MAFDAHKNFAISLVATAPSPAASGVTLIVTAGEGALFPAASFNAVVFPAGQMPTAANAEIVRVTAKATDTFTITRTQESTAARTIVIGDQICAAITLKTLSDIETQLTQTMPLAGGTLTGPISLGSNGYFRTDAINGFRINNAADTLNLVQVSDTGFVRLFAYTGTTFAAGDKYAVIDASGNLHRSAIGPAS